MGVYGDAGRLIIYRLGFSVPLYRKPKNISAQAVVDREDCALLQPRFNGGCDSIGDHANQGFHIIDQMMLGDTVMIQTPKETQCYECVAIMYGRSTKNDIIGIEGSKVSKCKWADLCMRTCRDDKGGRIMVWLKKSLHFDRPLRDPSEWT